MSYSILYVLILGQKLCSFQVGNACALPSDLGQFGLIVLVNSLHHFPDPLLFLRNAKDLVVPDGIMVIIDLYFWHDMLDLPKACSQQSLSIYTHVHTFTLDLVTFYYSIPLVIHGC